MNVVNDFYIPSLLEMEEYLINQNLDIYRKKYIEDVDGFKIIPQKNTNYINHKGVIELAVKSTKPNAEKLQDWIYDVTEKIMNILKKNDEKLIETSILSKQITARLNDV